MLRNSLIYQNNLYFKKNCSVDTTACLVWNWTWVSTTKNGFQKTVSFFHFYAWAVCRKDKAKRKWGIILITILQDRFLHSFLFLTCLWVTWRMLYTETHFLESKSHPDVPNQLLLSISSGKQLIKQSSIYQMLKISKLDQRSTKGSISAHPFLPAPPLPSSRQHFQGQRSPGDISPVGLNLCLCKRIRANCYIMTRKPQWWRSIFIEGDAVAFLPIQQSAWEHRLVLNELSRVSFGTGTVISSSTDTLKHRYQHTYLY